MFERAAESQVGERDRVATGFERRRDVLHAERFDAKERSQPETVVLGHRAQQEYVHGSAVKRNIEARAAPRGKKAKKTRTSAGAAPPSVSSPISNILSWSRRHRAVVLFCTACLAAVSIAGMRGLSFDTDVLSLLPRDGRVVPAFRTFVATFGSVDDLYVVLTAPVGHEISDYEDDVDAWGERLRETPGVVRVDTGRVDESRDLSWLADHRLLLLDDDHLGRALSRFSGDGLVASLRGRRALLSVPSPAIAGMVRHDPLGLYDLLREQLGSAQAGINLGVTEGGYVASDLRSRLLIAKPSQPPFDAGFSRALMTRLDALRDEMGRHAPRAGEPVSPDEDRPPLQVQFAGGHRIAVETESVIRRESILNTVGSLALILPLLFLVFRSLWLVFVGSIPSALSLVLTLGTLGFAGATLSTAATASSAMLFGLGVDGVVLLYVGYTLAVRAGAEPAAAIDGLGGPASSMLLGMWTTAATFYGLTFVDFPSLEQLGALIGHSMVICGILTLVMVPALLPRRRPTRPLRSLSMPRFASWVERRHRVVLAVALILTVLLAAAATRLRINPTLDQLRSVTPGAELLQRIGPMFGLPDDVYIVVAGGTNLEELLKSNERLRADVARALPGVTVQAATALLPSQATQDRRRAQVRQAGLSAPATAAALVEAEKSEGFKPGSFDPFRERLPALARARWPDVRGLRRARARRHPRPIRCARGRSLVAGHLRLSLTSGGSQGARDAGEPGRATRDAHRSGRS